MGPDGQLDHAEVLGRFVGAFVDELAAAGVEHVCLCPGSRSTPLALTFARHPRIKVWTHLDERSCAYFALGIGKASRQPVAILCSSGTAAVNFAPAVVEAFHSHVPLIVLTADRPPELREVGANQTIDQVGLYGSAVRWAVNLPLPEASDQVLHYVRMVAARAVDTAREGGPVHLNFPFREPLVPAPYDFAPEARPSFQVARARRRPTPEDLAAVLDQLSGKKRVLVVCGPQTDPDFADAVSSLALRLDWPVLADPISGVRYGQHHPANIISAYDNFLRSPAIAGRLIPDFVLRFGAAPTSKPLATFLQRHQIPQVLVADDATWNDPDLTASAVVYSDAASFCDALSATLASEPTEAKNWLHEWLEIERRAWSAIDNVLGPEKTASEVSVFSDLAPLLLDGTSLFAGNSMPVRDLDSFFPAGQRNLRFLASRGASGIDGVVSTALGVAAATQERLVLVIGDLSFYHDMNGLLAAKRFGLKGTIVLVNNDGGGIFSFLPQNEDQEHFEALFGTPHGLDFAPVAELYGLGWQSVTTREEYRHALAASFDAPGVNVIEVKTNRAENVRLHQRIWQAVADAVAPVVTK
jgi:2-succinyl-5-enolpyruvyl-6-hydroxy-3-cyclohexene-1-carboxylate synthase